MQVLLYEYVWQYILTTFVFHGGKLLCDYGRHPIELINCLPVWRNYAVPIVAKHWDRPPNIFGETSEYVPCGAIYWHRLANMCG